MKTSFDWKKVGFHTKKSVILFSNISYRFAREHPFVVGMLVFFALLYRYSPSVFLFLLSNSPVIICTAVLLGTLLSFGQPDIPDVTEEDEKEEERRQGVSFLKVGGSVDLVVVEKDENSKVQTPLLDKETNAMESFQEEENRVKNLTDDEGEMKGGEALPARKKGEEKKSGINIHVERQKDEKFVFGDTASEVDAFFTPRRAKGMEELQLDTSHLEREIHGHEMVEESALGEVQGDSASKGKLYCRSNSRTVCFVTNDIEKTKEDKTQEDYDTEIKHDAKVFEDRGKFPDPNVSDSFVSSLVLPQVWIDRHDQFSGSSSDQDESCSPDTSMVYLIPMLDEFHPLLDSEDGQSASVEVCDRNNAESSESHISDADDYGDEHTDGVDENDSIEVDKGGSKIQEGAHEGQKYTCGATWTEDDTNIVMDLGRSELERNQRLENLLAKCHSRRNQKIEEEEDLIDLHSEKDLIDLQSDDKLSLPDTDDSPVNMVLEPIQHQAPLVSPTKEKHIDLLYDGEEEIVALPVASSTRAPLAPSAKRKPLDVQHEHTHVDEMLVSETSVLGELMAGLKTGETHLLRASEFEVIDHNKAHAGMGSICNMSAINSVAGDEGFFYVNPTVDVSYAEHEKQQCNDDTSDYLRSSFHDHVVGAVDVNTQQSGACYYQLAEERVDNIQNESVNSSTSWLLQTMSVSPVDCQKEFERLHDKPNEVEYVHLEPFFAVEPAQYYPFSRDGESQSLEEVGHSEVSQEQAHYDVRFVHDIALAASDIRDEHFQESETLGCKNGSNLYAHNVDGDSDGHKESGIPSKTMQAQNAEIENITAASADDNVLLPDLSASKRQAGLDIDEENRDGSRGSASLEGDETKSGEIVEENDKINPLCGGCSSCYIETVKPECVDDHNWVREPLFHLGPSSLEKSCSGLDSMDETQLLVDKGVFQHHSICFDMETSKLDSSNMKVEEYIEQQCGENIVNKEGESMKVPARTSSEIILVAGDTLSGDVSELATGEQVLYDESDCSRGEALLEPKEAEVNEEIYSRQEASSNLSVVGDMELSSLGVPEVEEAHVIQVGLPAVLQDQTIQASQIESDSLLLERSVTKTAENLHISDSPAWLPLTTEGLLIMEGASQHVDDIQITPSFSDKYAGVAHTAELCQPLLAKDDEDFVHIDAHSCDAEDKSDSAVISMFDGSSSVDDRTIAVSDRVHVMGGESALYQSSISDQGALKVIESYDPGSVRMDYMRLSSDDAVPMGHTCACVTALTTSELLEPLKLLESSGSSGVEPEQSGFDDELPKHVHVLFNATGQCITKEEYVEASTVQESTLSVSDSLFVHDEMNQPHITGISQEHLGADDHIWIMGEGEVECIKDLDEDLLSELDTIGDFGVAKEMSSEQQMEQQTEHSEESKEAAETSSLTQMMVLEAQSVEDINLALKQFCEGESSEPIDHYLVEHQKSSIDYADGFAWEHLDVRHGQSEMEVVEARSLEDIASALKQLCEGDCEKHGSQVTVQHFSNLTDSRGVLEVLEARTVQDIDLVLKQFNKQGPGELSPNELIENQVKLENSIAERYVPESVETNLHPAIVEVHADKKRESGEVGKEELHHSFDVNRESSVSEDSKKIDDSRAKDMMGKVKKIKHKKSSSSGSTSSSSSSDSD